MKLPEQYKDLDIKQKKMVVSNLIMQYWNEENQDMIDGLTNEQVEFLFTYLFTESKEIRDRMRDNMQKKYELLLKDLKNVADKLQKLNLQFSELLAEKQDIEEFKKNRR